ncbi:uncharacterized protein PV09_00557 [Verruconis gallopava]|uniref:Uncharacterized protein n=1 Tax=Verruconis gallopava TaxID=253628 RepID=A0A0D1Y0L1_9PEZI|nr:uncharacterized protein PV09_00557 [Verruconis gallopava]KIW08596.1 hypothetical protein PV09_00557 [Verruconis gallopava]
MYKGNVTLVHASWGAEQSLLPSQKPSKHDPASSPKITMTTHDQVAFLTYAHCTYARSSSPVSRRAKWLMTRYVHSYQRCNNSCAFKFKKKARDSLYERPPMPGATSSNLLLYMVSELTDAHNSNAKYEAHDRPPALF